MPTFLLIFEYRVVPILISNKLLSSPTDLFHSEVQKYFTSSRCSKCLEKYEEN